MIRIDGPAFTPSASLGQFSCAACEPDLRYSIRLEEDIPLPDEPREHSELFTSYYGSTRVILNEHTGGILFRDTEQQKSVHRVSFQHADAAYFSTNAILRILDLPRQMIRLGGIFLHASYIIRNGKAVLFTAPKQTGKSTQAALWAAHRNAEIINGDRALLRRVDGAWHAFGSPYSGTSGICGNVSAPVAAIVILSQAADNTVRPASPREALIALLDGCSYETWNREQVSDVMDLCQNMLASVPFFCLACTPDLRAVEALETVL